MKIQKFIPTEDASDYVCRNQGLGWTKNPGRYGLTAPAALFGFVLYNTQHKISNVNYMSTHVDTYEHSHASAVGTLLNSVLTYKGN